MPLTGNGLVKLIEECGELTQIAAKKLSYMDTDEHPDGAGSMRERLQNEIGDASAAMVLVIQTLGLDRETVDRRCLEKIILFRKWQKEEADSQQKREPRGKNTRHRNQMG